MKKHYYLTCFCLILFITCPVYAQSGHWSDNGNYDTSWYNESNPLLFINTPEEFAGIYYLAEQGKTFEGKTIKLTSDLDLKTHLWKPIISFNGTLDGNNRTIKNLNIRDIVNIGYSYYVGLFAELKSHAIIQNLKIDNTCRINIDFPDVIAWSAVLVGYIAGYCYDGKITNCHTAGVISVTSNAYYTYVGGMVGSTQFRNSITDCSNAGTITSFVKQGIDNQVGGIAGNGISLFTNCSNTGSITAQHSQESDNNNNAGGISGCNGGFTNCHNAGTIQSIYTTQGSYGYAGGICGYHNGWEITDCDNTGYIYATGNVMYAGGITGFTLSAVINHCSNRGKIKAHCPDKKENRLCTSAYVGGICGFSEQATILNSHNEGEISSYSSCESRSSGISISRKIINCYNLGAVNASASEGEEYLFYSLSYAGGITASGGSATTLDNCYNAAPVTGSVKNESNPILGVDPIIAHIIKETKLTHTYYNSDITNLSTNTGIKLTNEQMKGNNYDFLSLLNGNAFAYNKSNPEDTPAYNWLYTEGKVFPDISHQLPTSIPNLQQENDKINVFSQNGQLYIESKVAQKVSIFSIDGQLNKILDVYEGMHSYELPPNIYIINNQKVIIGK